MLRVYTTARTPVTGLDSDFSAGNPSWYNENCVFLGTFKT